MVRNVSFLFRRSSIALWLLKSSFSTLTARLHYSSGCASILSPWDTAADIIPSAVLLIKAECGGHVTEPVPQPVWGREKKKTRKNNTAHCSSTYLYGEVHIRRSLLPGQVNAPSSCPDLRLLSKWASPRRSCAVWPCIHHFRRTVRPLAQTQTLKLSLLRGRVWDSFVSYMSYTLFCSKRKTRIALSRALKSNTYKSARTWFLCVSSDCTLINTSHLSTLFSFPLSGFMQ